MGGLVTLWLCFIYAWVCVFFILHPTPSATDHGFNYADWEEEDLPDPVWLLRCTDAVEREASSKLRDMFTEKLRLYNVLLPECLGGEKNTDGQSVVEEFEEELTSTEIRELLCDIPFEDVPGLVQVIAALYYFLPKSNDKKQTVTVTFAYEAETSRTSLASSLDILKRNISQCTSVKYFECTFDSEQGMNEEITSEEEEEDEEESELTHARRVEFGFAITL